MRRVFVDNQYLFNVYIFITFITELTHIFNDSFVIFWKEENDDFAMKRQLCDAAERLGC